METFFPQWYPIWVRWYPVWVRWSGSDDTLSGSDDTLYGSDDTLSGSDDTLSGSEDTLFGSDDTLSGSDQRWQKRLLVVSGTCADLFWWKVVGPDPPDIWNLFSTVCLFLDNFVIFVPLLFCIYVLKFCVRRFLLPLRRTIHSSGRVIYYIDK